MTSRAVRIGVQIQPQQADYPQFRDAVRRAEDLGVDVVFNWDHFFPLYGDRDGKHFESWMQLAAIAEQTSRVEFGALVNCNSYRNPDLQADMARTVDHISAGDDGVGRFIFGTGSGWFERDYVEYGYDFGTVGSRLDDLARDLPRVRSRWEKLNPPPTRHIPILIGGGGEKKTLRIVAEHADIWHSFSDPETLTRKLGVLRGHCDDVGRDVDEIELSTELGDQDRAYADQLHELGTTLFTFGVGGPDYDLAKIRPWIEWRDGLNG